MKTTNIGAILEMTTLKTYSPRSRGIIYGITQPKRREGFGIADSLIDVCTLGVYSLIKLEIDHKVWRDSNAKSDRKLREAFGKNYWRSHY